MHHKAFPLLFFVLAINGIAVVGSVMASHYLAEGTVVSEDTLIPLGVIVILIGAAIKATWALGRFFDKLESFEKRLEELEKSNGDKPSKP